MKTDLDRALDMISSAGRCVRSDDLARKLKLPADAVFALLAPAVESGYLIACRVIRPGNPDAVDYRVSEAHSGTARPANFGDFSISQPKPYKQPPVARRNAGAASRQEPVIMAKPSNITRQQVLAAIIAAGPAGISRTALAEHFACPVSNTDMHITALNRLQPPVIFKPEKGVVVAIEYQDKPTDNAGAVSEPPAVPVLTASRPETVALIATTPASPVASTPMDESEIADLINSLEPEEDTWPNRPPVVTPQEAPAGFTEIVIADADAAEMAVWSNGALTIDDGAVTIQLSVAVTRKLRNYLGLFAEDSPC